MSANHLPSQLRVQLTSHHLGCLPDLAAFFLPAFEEAKPQTHSRRNREGVFKPRS